VTSTSSVTTPVIYPRFICVITMVFIGPFLIATGACRLVTLAEVKAASKRLHDAGERYLTYKQIFASIDAQRVLVEQATTKTKQLRREQERTTRALRGGTPARSSHQQEDAPEADEDDVGPILPYPVEEWST
jgi:putative transposase